MTAAVDLYRAVVLEHGKRPRNRGPLPCATHAADGDNPLCGDAMRVELEWRDARLSAIGFTGESCVLATASASLMTERLRGLSLEEARQISKEDVLDELGIQVSPARLKCALLSLKVLKVGAYGLAGEEDEEA